MINKHLEEFNDIILIIAGVVCLIFNSHIYEQLPIIFSLIMLERGISDIYEGYHRGDIQSLENMGLERGVMFVIVAIGIFVQGKYALFVIGVFWGLAGLLKASHHLNSFLYHLSHHEPCFKIFIELIIEVVLAMVLIFDPSNNIAHHIIILGVELIIYGIIDGFSLRLGLEV